MTVVDGPRADPGELRLADLQRCFGGGIPAVLATASHAGVPNVTYISRAHQVDDDRIALSNQFLSKSARNLAGNPRASVLLMDPITHDEYRLLIAYERTERRGPLFERMRADIDGLAAAMGMQDVFRLRAADVFRVLEIERIPSSSGDAFPGLDAPGRTAPPELAALAELAGWLDRATDLDIVIDAGLEGLDLLLGYRHTMLLLLDESGRRLYTIAGRGFPGPQVGAEVRVGEGQIGLAAARCEIQRITGLRQLQKYSRTVRRAYEDRGVHAGREIPMPGLADVDSRIVVPVRALGEMVGLLVAESPDVAAFDVVDEHVLGVAASMLGNAIEHARALASTPEADRPAADAPVAPAPTSDPCTVRFFAVDGSTFVDGEYLIKGVAGRILWSLLCQHDHDGRTEFSNKELRLDRSLDLPGFKDNLESRLILLKRRLDERDAPVRIDKTGRGRFRIVVSAPIRLDAPDR